MPQVRFYNGVVLFDDPTDRVAFEQECCCGGCGTCPCCLTCPTESQLIQFRISGLSNTDFCDCVDFATWETLQSGLTECSWEYDGFGLCEGLNTFAITLEIVQEDGQCILRLTMTGDSSGGSGGGGGPFTVIFEKTLWATSSPGECSDLHSLDFVSQTADNSPCDFSGATAEVNIEF